jgi:hypothetical protein
VGRRTAYLALALIGIATLAVGSKATGAAATTTPPTVMHIYGDAVSLPASLDAIHAGDGLAADSTGNLYVGYERSDLSEHVAVFDGQGHFVRDWEVEHPANSHVPKVAVGGPDGLVYVLPSADPETIKVYKPDGTFVRQFAGGSIATDSGDIEVDASGNVYVSSAAVTGRPDRFVVRFDPAGSVTGTWVPQPGGRANAAGAIAVAPDGSIYEVGLGTVATHSTLTHLASNGSLLSSKDLDMTLGQGNYKDVDYANGRLYLSGTYATAAGTSHLHALAVLGPNETVQDQILGAGNKVAVSGTHVWVSGLSTSTSTSTRRAASSSEFAIGGMDEVPIVNSPKNRKWANFLSGCNDSDTAEGKEYGNIPTLIVGTRPAQGCNAVIVNDGTPCRPGSSAFPGQAYLGGKAIGVPIQTNPGLNEPSDQLDQTFVKIPANQLQTGPVIFSWSCRNIAGQEVEHLYEWKASVYRLGDPSGAVYDARTGHLVTAAAVRLESSSSAGGPFGVPLPLTTLPQTDQETTGVDGGFSWDVADGYWRLQASAVGYHSLTSRVYKVPPEVTGIRLELRPDPAQQRFLIDPSGRIGRLRIGMKASPKLRVRGLGIRVVHGRIESIKVRSKRYQTAQRIKLGTKRLDFESAYGQPVKKGRKAPKRFDVKKATFTVKAKVTAIKLGR